MSNNSLSLFFFIGMIISSCGISRTHHKNKLIDFKKNEIPTNSIKLDGYYYSEMEREYDEFLPHPIDEYYQETGIKKIKYLSIFLIYEDGFAVKIGEIDGLSKYYCAEKSTYENTYESAHESVRLILESQNSEIKRTSRVCSIKPNDIDKKALVKIKNNVITIQFYLAEMQNPNKDSFNSYYLHEMNGFVKSDSSFIITSETQYRYAKTSFENIIFRFRQTLQKPIIMNYFKKHQERFQ